MSNSSTPQNLLSIAVQAFERAQGIRLQVERELQSQHQNDRDIQTAEKSRLGELLQIVREIEQTATALLYDGGLAYMQEGIAQADAPLSNNRQDGAWAFAQAPTAISALHVALLKLGEAYLSAGDFEQARQVVSPLLVYTTSLIYQQILDLVCESHYRPAVAALKAGKWETGRAELVLVTKLNNAYRNSAKLLRESYLRPALQFQSAKQWKQVVQCLEEWVHSSLNSGEEERTLLATAYTNIASQLAQEQRWSELADVLKRLKAVQSNFDLPAWLKQYTPLMWFFGALARTQPVWPDSNNSCQYSIQLAEFSSNGRSIYTILHYADSRNLALRVWDLISGTVQEPILLRAVVHNGVQLVGAMNRLFYWVLENPGASPACSFIQLDILTGKQTVIKTDSLGPHHGILASEDGNLLATVHTETDAGIDILRESKILYHYPISSKTWAPVVFSPDHHLLVLHVLDWNDQPRLDILKVTTGERQCSISVAQGYRSRNGWRESRAVFSTDSQRLMLYHPDSVVCFNAASGIELWQYKFDFEKEIAVSNSYSYGSTSASSGIKGVKPMPDARSILIGVDLTPYKEVWVLLDGFDGKEIKRISREPNVTAWNSYQKYIGNDFSLSPDGNSLVTWKSESNGDSSYSSYKNRILLIKPCLDE